jgi:Uma2 family endonuclease
VTDPAAPRHRMTVEEFLAWAETQEEPYELEDGVPVPLWPRDPAQPRMMAPPSRRHQRIVRNIELVLESRVRPPCWVAAGIGVRLADERSRVPDVLAACVEHDEAANLVDEPALLVEVLSPRNEGTDRTVKLDEYKSLPSVREIWLVASTRRWAQVWRREADTWIGVDLIGRGTIESPWLASQVPLDELYAGVNL